jgi:hypothetical protein
VARSAAAFVKTASSKYSVKRRIVIVVIIGIARNQRQGALTSCRSDAEENSNP